MLWFFLTHYLLCQQLSKLPTPQRRCPAPGISVDIALLHTAYFRCPLHCICHLSADGSRQSLTALPTHALHAAAQIGTLSDALDRGFIIFEAMMLAGAE